jgi:hypothetical protein
MKKVALIAAAILALAVAPSLAEAQVTHVTIEGGTMSFNFPANQDTLVSHFEMCVAVGATPVACTSASTGFAPVSITSKAADPTQPSLNLYKVGPPLRRRSCRTQPGRARSSSCAPVPEQLSDRDALR